MFARPRLSNLTSSTQQKYYRKSTRTLDTQVRLTTIDRHKSLTNSKSVHIQNNKYIFKPVQNFNSDADRQQKFQQLRKQKVGYLRNAYSIKNKLNDPKIIINSLSKDRINSITDIKNHPLLSKSHSNQKAKLLFPRHNDQMQENKFMMPKFFNYCEEIEQRGSLNFSSSKKDQLPKALNSQSNKVKSMKSILQTPSTVPITFKNTDFVQPNADWIRKSYKPFLEIFQKLQLQKFTMKRLEKGFYFGYLKNNIMDGKGMIFYQNGKVYEGNFKQGKKQGLGYEYYPDKSYYLGNFYHNRRQGKGRFEWSNGQIYDGQWLNGKKQGSGIWKGSDGVSYVGEWHSDVIDGFGVLLQKNTRYEGQFKNYMKCGNGTIRFQNGEIYTGMFKHNLPSDHGDYYWKNGDHYSGQFLNGKRHGKGILKKSNGYYYEGQFQNDKKSGVGQQKLQQGIFYKGQYENDYRHGWGVMLCDNKIIYQGFWVNNAAINDKNNRISTIIQQQASVNEKDTQNNQRNDKIQNPAILIRNKMLKRKQQRWLGQQMKTNKSKQKNTQDQQIKPFRRACNCQRHRSKQY